VPPWKAVLTIYKTASVAPEHQRNIVLQELFGASRDEESNYFPDHVVEHFVRSRKACATTEVIYVAIDPASHDTSTMGLIGMTFAGSDAHVLGAASVRAQRCAVVEVQTIVGEFVRRLKDFASDDTMFVFIIECNGSSVYAASILRACIATAKPYIVLNPWTTANFASEITACVGPWTTHLNKYAAVEKTLEAMLDKTLFIHPACVTVGHESVNVKEVCPRVEDTLKILGSELKRVSDDGKKINGKAGGQDDDLAMALFLGVFWLAFFFAPCFRVHVANRGSPPGGGRSSGCDVSSGSSYTRRDDGSSVMVAGGIAARISVSVLDGALVT
jgi:hypothetical protein